MKIISIFILSFYIPVSLGQTGLNTNYKKSGEYFDLGVTMFMKNEIRKADSLFTKSLLLQPSKDALYNRALTRLFLNDSCSGCLDLLRCSELFFDKKASDLYSRLCIKKIDTIFYDKKHNRIENEDGYKYYEEIINTKCKSLQYGYVHKKNHYTSVRINADLSKSDRNVDIYATYIIIDSIKYYDFIYSYTFGEDNKDNIEAFKERLTQYLDAKYKFENIPYAKRYCSVSVLINSEGLVIKSEIKSSPFDSFDKLTRANIEEDIINSFKTMPQLKPARLFGDLINIKYDLVFGI
jgi:hypothetical protein